MVDHQTASRIQRLLSTTREAHLLVFKFVVLLESGHLVLKVLTDILADFDTRSNWVRGVVEAAALIWVGTHLVPQQPLQLSNHSGSHGHLAGHMAWVSLWVTPWTGTVWPSLKGTLCCLSQCTYTSLKQVNKAG